jgi:hypothetical protein
VIRLFVGKAGGAPGVGIDDALDDRDAVLLEERPQFGRQERDRALHDEVVRFEAPGIGSPRKPESGDQHEDEQPHAHGPPHA